MRKSTTTSNFRILPRGFILVAVLFLLTEWFLYANRAELVDDYWNKFLINERALIDAEGDHDYLIIGNSLQKTGISPAKVDDGLLNLGLAGAKPMGQYLLLNRYLKNHAPPKTVFMYVDPEDMRDSPLVILRYFVRVPEFLEIFRDLTWRERGCFFMRYFVSLDERKVGLTKRDAYPYRNRIFVKEMTENRGFMPAPRADRALADDHFAKTEERSRNHVSISKRDMKYLDKFMELASSRGVAVVFLGFLVPKELDGIFEENGFNKEYLALRLMLKQKYPEARFVADPILYLENGYFGDRSHLNRAGSEAYTLYFKTQAFEKFKEAL